MGTAVIPYSFSGLAAYPYTQQPATPGHTQGVYIALHPDHYEMIVGKIMGWFEGRPEIDLVDTGVSDKLGLGYIILEWIEHESINSSWPSYATRSSSPTTPSIFATSRRCNHGKYA